MGEEKEHWASKQKIWILIQIFLFIESVMFFRGMQIMAQGPAVWFVDTVLLEHSHTH